MSYTHKLRLAGMLAVILSLTGCLFSEAPETPTPEPTPDPHIDHDQDGTSGTEGDCDNLDSSVYPGATEYYDGKDNDCDHRIDEDTGNSDDDGDGYSEFESDCNDADPTVHPNQADEIDGTDNDCDDLIDEDGNWGGTPDQGAVGTLELSSASAELVRTYQNGSFIADAQFIRDLDGDGRDELAVAVLDADCQGRVFLFYGRPEGLTGTIDVSTADAIFEGIGGPNLNGTKIVGGSDLNGDGFNDLLIGDILHQRISFFAGGGRYGGLYSAADATATFLSVSGGSYLADIGCSIALPGDVDGDGKDDLIIGQPGFDNCRGRVLFIRGGRPYQGQVDIEHADSIFEGETPGDFAGGAVSGVGDLDADGLADFIVSAPSSDFDPSGGFQGVLYLNYGKAGGWVRSSSLKDTSARLSTSINLDAIQMSHGDFDGDGLDDLALGFPCQKVVIIVYGAGSTRLTGNRVLEDVAGTFVQSSDGSGYPYEFYDIQDAGFGASVGLSSDYNDDGIDDLVVAAATSRLSITENVPGEIVVSYDPGYVAFFPGHAGRPASLRAAWSNSTLLHGETGVLETVYPISTGGDFDGNGRPDLLVGSEIDALSTAALSHTFLFSNLTF